MDGGLEQALNADMHEQIIEFLSTTELLGTLQKNILKKLVPTLGLVRLEGSTTLLHKGDTGDALYILVSGRLRVIDVSAEGEEIILNEVAPGESVGEIALLLNEKRAATVHAIRDSVLLKLTRNVFDQLMTTYSAELMNIARASIRRLLVMPQAPGIPANVSSIAIVPAGNSNQYLEFANELVAQLNRSAPTLLLNQQICDQLYGRKIAQTHLEDSDNIAFTAWLDANEAKHRYVLYATDQNLTPWTLRCLRQADRIFLIADATDNPQLNEIESSLFSEPKKSLPSTELVLLYPADTSRITGTQAWLKPRRLFGHHHVRIGSEADLAKLARFITGTALGVVLSGGGARGLAHIGVIRAMQELKIPIDMIGGSSIGGLIAAGYSVGMNSHGILENIERATIMHRPDFTVPWISLLTGKYATKVLRESLGTTTCIEDLWTRFYCVSTDISHGILKVHNEGLLWRSARATIALPGILPPVLDGNDMLLDGAIINNLPVDVMRKQMNSGKIFASSLAFPRNEFRYKSDENWFSGLRLLLQHLNPFVKTHTPTPNIFEITIAAMTLASRKQQEKLAQLADFCLSIPLEKYRMLDFKLGSEIADLGYQIALPELKQIFGK